MVCAADPSPAATASPLAGSYSIGGHKVSTVVPASVTGEEHERHELSNMDLAMKLHYLRCVYYFEASSVISELSTPSLKAPMFPLLELHHVVAGRIRRDDESGRPFVKCNDSGVRIVEARCEEHTLDEWLQRKKGRGGGVAVVVPENVQHKQLVPDKVVGPDLHFSPLVYIQFTWFKCGGLAVGLSWSHLLGDAASASNFINLWGQLLGDKQQRNGGGGVLINRRDQHRRRAAHEEEYRYSKPKPKPKPTTAEELLVPLPARRCIKQVVARPTDSKWIAPNKVEMDSASFHITEAQLKSMLSKVWGDSSCSVVAVFEAISAVIWQCLARVRREDGHSITTTTDGDTAGGNIITVCRTRTRTRTPSSSSSSAAERGQKNMVNEQIISCVESKFSSPPEDAKLLDLATLIAGGGQDENTAIEQGGYVVEYGDDAVPPAAEDCHCILYGGANLTFVDMEKIDLYGLELKGQKPVLVDYSIGGVGDEGAVLVFQGPAEREGVSVSCGGGTGTGTGTGRLVNVTLPVEQLQRLRQELARDWGIA